MSISKPVVIVTRKLPDVVEKRMAELFDTKFNHSDRPMSSKDIADAVSEADILVPTLTDNIDAGVIARCAPRCRLIANYGAGVDHIDIATARSHGITVTNTPGVLTEDTADLTMALILATHRRLAEGIAMMQEDRFVGWSPTHMLGRRLQGRRLGIIGMGRVGSAVARRAKAFGLEINYHNRKPVAKALSEELGATYWDSLNQMLAHMDIISVNCPHTPATFHLLSAPRLKMLSSDAIIINTSRGEVIDENALARLLDDDKLGGAGLDVYEHEPAVNPKLRHNNKVTLLPHMASATQEGRVDMGEKVIINIKTFCDGHTPPDRVFASLL